MFLSCGARTSVETLVPHREPSNSLLLEKLLVCAHPKRPSAVAILSLLVLLPLASPLAAQDRFGAAVTLTAPDEVVVLKPGAAIGPSAAVIYRLRADGVWTQAQRLSKLSGGYPGEVLIPELTAGGDFLLLGSGDPDGREAGHLYQKEGDAWVPQLRVPMDPSTAQQTASLPAGGLDMPTLTRLMEPPARRVVLSPDGTRLAVAGGSNERETVHVLLQVDGTWTLEAALRGPDSGGGPTAFGAAIALGDGRLMVGAPREGPGGAVHLFEHGGSGWTSTAVFRADSLESDGLLGTALALSAESDEAFASAPGRNRVLHFAAGPDAIWRRGQELTPPAGDDEEGLAFGAALALDGDRLVVGAPLAEQGRGRAYVLDRGEGGWTLERTLMADDLNRAAFGTAVALRGDRVVVGAPSAFGNAGRVAVFDLDAEGAPAWLEPGAELESVTGSDPIPCADGAAAGFECDGVDLVSFLPLSSLGAEPGERVSDVWGWTDPETGREYALVGRTAGLAFVDISSPGAPRLVGLMAANPSGARDIKVYRDYAFMTGDGAGDHGLLIFDLTRLRNVLDEPATFEPDARYDEVASAHNLVIDTESGFAYTVGTNTGGQSCGGGLHMIDIREPLQPTFAGCYTDTEGLIWTGRTHDAQCTVYRGPDETYHGRQICFAANETAMRIVDVTDKSAPQPISTASHPGTAYVHQGWLTEDHRYLYVNDELDEIVGTVERTRTLIYDVAELEDPILVAEHLGPDQATDHNLYITGNRAYLANYQAGFRILDVSDPERPVEIGWFDTTPYGENPPGFGGGAWTAWPFFESGMVVVSSMNEGLFILRPQRPVT
jgi:choice-of-anchor B domain-containing protein